MTARLRSQGDRFPSGQGPTATAQARASDHPPAIGSLRACRLSPVGRCGRGPRCSNPRPRSIPGRTRRETNSGAFGASENRGHLPGSRTRPHCCSCCWSGKTAPTCLALRPRLGQPVLAQASTISRRQITAYAWPGATARRPLVLALLHRRTPCEGRIAVLLIAIPLVAGQSAVSQALLVEASPFTRSTTGEHSGTSWPKQEGCDTRLPSDEVSMINR